MNKTPYARRFKFGRRANDNKLVLDLPKDDAQRLADEVATLIREMPASKEYFENLIALAKRPCS